jgi:DNA-binding CsgD family transcriptional regulator
MSMLVDNHHSLVSSGMVKELCNPLFNTTKLTYFHYAKIYDNGTTSTLVTHPELHAHFWHREYERKIFKNYSEGIFFNESFSTAILSESRTFYVDYFLLMIVRYNNYYESCGFATIPGNEAILQTYLRHMDLLKKFIFYFKEKGECLVKEADNHLLPVDGYSMADIPTQKNENELFSFTPKKYKLYANSTDILITAKEFQVLKLIAYGCCTKEMANKLNISLKTVETHLMHIRQKLGYTRRSDLVKCFLESPYA